MHGIPQGSVLRPLLYVLYTTPIADIIKSFDLKYHLYADDKQIHVYFSSQSQEGLYLVKSKLELCVKHVYFCMVSNGLKLNQDKTECLPISSRHSQHHVLRCL